MKDDKAIVKIVVEKGDVYTERVLPKRVICALFDLQYAIDWNNARLNCDSKHLRRFFDVIEYIDDAQHKPVEHTIEDGKIIGVPKTFWLHGKPKWKRIENADKREQKARKKHI
jgi:hypothetical protein